MVSVFSDHLVESVAKDYLIRLLGKACTVDDDDEYEAVINEARHYRRCPFHLLHAY